MDAEFSVELGADDPTLAVPWRSPDGANTYVDLRLHPELIEGLSEARQFPELAEFLRAVNRSRFSSAKCDAWFDQLMDVNDEPYEAEMKCASYVDLFFDGAQRLADFAIHEAAARAVVQHLSRLEDLSARAEIIIRRAYFEEDEGLYWTMYVFGYGNAVETARRSWQQALALVQSALVGERA
jgi:hypothetical protein